MRLWIAAVTATVLSVAVLGCGGGGHALETPFEEAGKEAQAADRRFKEAVRNFEQSSARYNRELNREYREHPAASLQRTCAHLRGHQLHSKNRILAQEAAEFLREEC